MRCVNAALRRPGHATVPLPSQKGMFIPQSNLEPGPFFALTLVRWRVRHAQKFNCDSLSPFDLDKNDGLALYVVHSAETEWLQEHLDSVRHVAGLADGIGVRAGQGLGVELQILALLGEECRD